jgi:DNA helicase-2/ATP-dependent DNA helicase PcrA
MSNDVDILCNLTSAQREAVTYYGGPLLIIAGPGSGKTEVISCRAAYLIRSNKVKPENLLAATFTEKAALKLKDRIQKKLPEVNVEAMQVSTLHSFCFRLLDEFRSESPFPRGFRVLDEAGQRLFVFSRRKDLGLNEIVKGRECDFFGEVLRTYNLAAEELVDPVKFEAWCDTGLAAAGSDEKSLWEERACVARSYRRYLELLQEAEVVDFGNLQRQALEMLKNSKDVLRQVRDQFHEILIDEYQDTNAVQEDILFLVASPRQCLSVVGDDDQSIYRFRGATVKNILNFDKKHASVKVVKLEDNFRSLRPIIVHCSQLIRCNPKNARLDKELRCKRKDWSNDLIVIHEHSAAEEAKAVASVLRSLVADGTISRLNDVAVLMRSVHSYAEPYLDALREVKIPFRVIGDGRFFERADIEEICGLFTFLGATKPWGDRFVRCTLIGLSEETEKTLKDFKGDLVETTGGERLKKIGIRDTTDQAKIIALIELKSQVQEGRHHSFLEVFYEILRISGYFARAERGSDEEAVRNMGILTKIISDFDEHGGTRNIYSFLSYLKLLREGAHDSYCRDPDDAVSVMTVHQAKGLEFPVVVIGAAMHGRFPVRERRSAYEIPRKLMRSGSPEVRDPHIVDERKLFYVAATRTRDLLIIGTADIVNKRGGGPSEFISELAGAGLAEAERRGKDLSRRAFRVEEVGEKSHEPRLRLSYYQIANYLQCPLRYRYFHVDGMANILSDRLYFGSAVHRALELLHRDLMAGKKVTEDDVARYVGRAWMPVWSRKRGLEAEEKERKSMEAAVAQVSRYVREHKRFFAAAEEAERPFAFDLEGVVIAGKIDLVRSAAGNKKEIIDFKTYGSKIGSREQAELQMDIYALGLKNSAEIKVGRQTLHFLEDGVVWTTGWDAKKCETVSKKLCGIIGKIKVGDFKPRVEYCPICTEFKNVCPYYNSNSGTRMDGKGKWPPGRKHRGRQSRRRQDGGRA